MSGVYSPELDATYDLAPLGEINDRVPAAERCIGPLMTLAAFQHIDFIRNERFEYALHENAEYADVLSGMPDTSSLIVPAEFLGRKLGAEEFLRQSSRRIKSLQTSNLSAEQSRLFSKYSSAGTDIIRGLSDSLSTQGVIIGKIALPAYLQALGRDEFAENDIVVPTLRNDDFGSILKSLSFGANGTYSPDNLPDGAGNVFLGISAKLKAHGVQPVPVINVSTLCYRTKEGNVSLTPEAVRLLRIYLRLDNKDQLYHPSGTSFSGSRGCPVSIKTVSVREDDFTDQQWDGLLGGDNPIASFDYPTSKLKLKRNAITEYTHLIADVLDSTKS